MKTIIVACRNVAILPPKINTCFFANMLHNETETRKRINNRLNHMEQRNIYTAEGHPTLNK
jgi:hypothetical protein